MMRSVLALPLSLMLALLASVTSFAHAQDGAPVSKPSVPPLAGGSEPRTEQNATPAPGAVQTPLAVFWESRLAALTPSDPEAYFRLGEDVAAKASQPADVKLARELFVLAYELDRKTGGRKGLMGAACVALADIAPLRADRRWLWAIAGAVDPRYATKSADVRAASRPGASDALAAATVIGQVRAGDGGAARQGLSNPAVLEALRPYDAQIFGNGAGIEKLQKLAEKSPCPECRNARVIKVPGSNPPKYRVCSTCEGNPGPKLSRDELIATLRVESWILDGQQRTWAAQVAADEGAPLHDPDPAELAPTYGVDPANAFWRNGRWSPAG